MLQLQDVSVRYGDTSVLTNVSAGFAAGELVAIIGPNGAGKSTMLSVVSRLKAPSGGTCLLWNKPVAEWPRRDFAKRVAIVPQAQPVEFPFSAEQVVLMGRAPFAPGMFESPEDVAKAEEAMRLTDVLPFRDRDVRTLSGGERQRVVLAAAIAQQPELLLLDEPTTYLDLRHQISMYKLLVELCGKGLCALCATHDLNLAAAFASRVLLLREGVVAAEGSPEEVLTPSLLSGVFDTSLLVRRSPSGRPWVFYDDGAWQ